LAESRQRRIRWLLVLVLLVLLMLMLRMLRLLLLLCAAILLRASRHTAPTASREPCRTLHLCEPLLAELLLVLVLLLPLLHRHPHLHLRSLKLRLHTHAQHSHQTKPGLSHRSRLPFFHQSVNHKSQRAARQHAEKRVGSTKKHQAAACAAPNVGWTRDREAGFGCTDWSTACFPWNQYSKNKKALPVANR
jgi:hypothetical protein